MVLKIQHLGYSGLRIQGPGVLELDPPRPGSAPAVLTWSERERVQGAEGSSALAAPGGLLSWLNLHGTALPPDTPVHFGAVEVTAWPYDPIPYATPREALRKTRSALLSPAQAVRRIRHALTRPRLRPVALRLRWPELEIAYLHQALHRFLEPAQQALWVERAASADVVIAGTDFDDEPATASLFCRMQAPHLILADLTGPIRRELGLPVRPLEACLDAAPPRTLALEPHRCLEISHERDRP